MSEPRPAVSVVVPTHNRADLIRQTLDSVLAQTFTDFEIIVVDNGSTDGTDRVVAAIDDPRIRYHWQEDSGLPANSRNVGISMARGEYVAFLDSDDLWLPRKLELQLARFREHPEAGLVYGDAVYFGETERAGRSLIRGIVEGSIFAELIQFNRIPTLTVMVRKACFGEVGVFSEDRDVRTTEDYELWLRIAHRYPVYAVREVVARYRVHDANMLGQSGGFDAVFKVLERIGRDLAVDAGLMRKAYAMHYAEAAWSYYRAGNRRQFEAAYHQSMAHRFYTPLALFRLIDLAFGPKLATRLMQRAGLS